MAELAIGLVGAAATVGASTLATGSGFTGRHEVSHREEILETRRSTTDFMTSLKSGDVTPDEENEFLKIREEAITRGNEYHEIIESYKWASWLKLLSKLKMKKEVRKRKRLMRQSNHSLRSLNESIYSGSDTSSICASSGSPPGSNLAVADIQDWADDVAVERAPSPIYRPRKRPRHTSGEMTSCWPCHAMKLECDEAKPNCMQCIRAQRSCAWPVTEAPVRKRLTLIPVGLFRGPIRLLRQEVRQAAKPHTIKNEAKVDGFRSVQDAVSSGANEEGGSRGGVGVPGATDEVKVADEDEARFTSYDSTASFDLFDDSDIHQPRVLYVIQEEDSE
ncbi:hypothetical protein FB451DRAFT_1275287 [Mycena latifolia]|nr:hypothetical protein FB451DRAFT_1275287 [Mycena latifolia]